MPVQAAYIPDLSNLLGCCDSSIAMDTDFDPNSDRQFSPGKGWFGFSLWRCLQKKTQVMNTVEWETIFFPSMYFEEQEHFYKFKAYFC